MAPQLPQSPKESNPAEAQRRRATKTMIALAVLLVVVPFLFWRGTWFGRPLSEEETAKYLSDPKQPRHIQHALVQIGERIARGDPAVQRWYPQVVALKGSPIPEIRVTLAWVLGTDNRAEEFHPALLSLLQDSEPLVRRNAALSLVRFGDARGRQEILAMLRPYPIQAPADGTVRFRLREGNPVDRGTLLGRVEEGDSEPAEIRSPLPGALERRLVEDNARVQAGQPILLLASASDEVWEALRALYLIGRAEDLPEVERLLPEEGTGMSDRIQQQARLTVEEIRRREEKREGADSSGTR